MKIKIIKGIDIGSEFELTSNGLILGRKNATITIKDPEISGHHCKLSVTSNAAWIEDLGSSNGTWVNQKKITKQQLKHNDYIQIGVTVLQFLEEANPHVRIPTVIQKMQLMSDAVIPSTQIKTDSELESIPDLEKAVLNMIEDELHLPYSQFTDDKTQNISINEFKSVFKVKFLSGPFEGQIQILPKPQFKIGRVDCDIIVDDSCASRNHAECALLLPSKSVILRDLQSSNGVFVNQRRITECELQPDDLVEIGNTRLRIWVENEKK